MIKQTLRMSAFALLAFTACSVAFQIKPSSASAANAADWKAGRIIDDMIFQNKSSMSVTQIQQFLDSKVPACDRWGTQAMWTGGPTRAQWSAENGKDLAPYTCLKEYVENPLTKANNANDPTVTIEGGLSAAQLIYNAAQAQNINPQVLLVLLQKEQSLVTDDWPYAKQFERATGNNCPDTAPCNPAFAWFWTQVNNAGAQFNYYVNNLDDFNYAPGWNNILNHPNTSCGTQRVFIENKYTAALFIYTPYAPNQAALANMYGTGDGCSSYGNRNFWRLFSDWFGRTTVLDPYDWEVIKTDADPRYFLVVGNTKRHIPTSELYFSWKLDQNPVKTVTQSYSDSIPTIPALGRLGYLEGKYYFVDNGRRTLLDSDTSLKTWGLFDSRSLAAPLYSILANLSDGGTASNYAANDAGQTYLLINGTKHLIEGTFAQNWQANPVTVSAEMLQGFTNGSNITNKISINSVWHVADSNRLIKIETPEQARAWGIQNDTYTAVHAAITQQFKTEQFNRIVKSQSQPHWYLTIDGKRTYLQNLDYAKIWNVQSTSALAISGGLFTSMSEASYTTPLAVKLGSSPDVYILDGQKRKLSSSVVQEALLGTTAIVDVTQQTLDSLPTGNEIDSVFFTTSAGFTFTASSGEIYYIRTNEVLGSLGYQRKYSKIVPISQYLANILYKGKEASGYVQSGGTTYYMQSGYAYPLKTEVISNWLATRQPIAQNASGMNSRYDVLSAQQLGNFVKEGSDAFVMSDGSLVKVASQDILPAEVPSASTTGLTRRTATGVLAKSSLSSDQRVWLLHNGTKQHVLSGTTYNAFSSPTTPPTTFSPSALESFSTVGTGDVSTLIASPSGYKLLTPRGFISVANASSALELRQAIAPKEVSSTTFSMYQTNAGTINRLFKTDDGKIYIIQNGTKRWILSQAALNSLLPFGPIIQLEQPLASTIPSGPIVP